MAFFTHFHTWGNSVHLRYVDDNGNRKMKEIKDFSPILYLNSPDPTPYKTLKGGYLKPVEMGSIREAKDFLEEYKDVIGFDIYGNTKWEYSCIADMFPGEIKSNMNQIRVFYYDIETKIGQGFPKPEKADQEINVISIFVDGVVYVFCVGDPGERTIEHEYPVEMKSFKNERTMLEHFLIWWTNDYPDIVTGWFIDGFDTPYLVNRIEHVLGESSKNRLSPYGIIQEKKVDNDRKGYKVQGIAFIDYVDLFKKYMMNARESYKLDDICAEEIDATKLNYDEFATLKDFYQGDFPKFVDYNIRDTILVKKLDMKLNLLATQVVVSHIAKVNFSDPFSPVRTWDVYLQNQLKVKGIFVDAKWHPRGSDRTIVGGYVKEPMKGKYEWPVTFDAKSLYPSIMMAWNISPETKVHINDIPEELLEFANQEHDITSVQRFTHLLKKYNLTMAANGVFYRRDVVGIIPEQCHNLTTQRAEAKALMLKKKAELKEIEAEIERLGGKE